MFCYDETFKISKTDYFRNKDLSPYKSNLLQFDICELTINTYYTTNIQDLRRT